MTSSSDSEEYLRLMVDRIVASGITDIDDICEIIAESLCIPADELKAKLRENPLVGTVPTHRDTIIAAVLGVSEKSNGAK
jgi:hypothetical protein